MPEMKIRSGKDARRLAEEAEQRKDALADEIARMFARRAASRYLWHEKWGARDGYAYSK
jgi:hypothetical protein